MYLHDSLFLSIISYCIAVWGVYSIDRLNTLRNKFFKKLLYLPRYTPGHAIRYETGLPPLDVMVFDYIVNWLRKVEAMGNDRFPKLCLIKLHSFALINSHRMPNWYKEVCFLYLVAVLQMPSDFS